MTARCLRIWSARALWWVQDRSKSCKATRSTIWRGGARNSTWFSSTRRSGRMRCRPCSSGCRGGSAHRERARAGVGERQVKIVQGAAFDFRGGGGENSDVFSLAPPFRQNALPAVLERLPARLAALARVYVEAAAPLEPRAAWEELKRSRAGQGSHQPLEWRGGDQGRLPGNA